MTLAEWAGAVRLQSEAAAARCRELHAVTSELELPADYYADLVARLRVCLSELASENDRLRHDVRNLQQVLYVDGLDGLH